MIFFKNKSTFFYSCLALGFFAASGLFLFFSTKGDLRGNFSESQLMKELKGEIKKEIQSAGEDSLVKSKVQQAAAKIAIPFVSNEGQIDNPEVKFSANIFSGTGFVTKEGIVYSLFFPEKKEKEPKDEIQKEKEENRKGIALKEFFLDDSGNLIKYDPQGEDKSSAEINYFIGQDQDKWRSKVSAYNQLDFGQVWPGIEVVLKAHGDNFEKIFQVSPNASPEDIAIAFEGINNLTEDEKTKQLILDTELGLISMTAPIAYQEDPKTQEKKYYSVRYAIKDNKTYGFVLPEGYDKNLPLIIDPLLASTFLGTNNYYEAVAVDNADNVYVTGVTSSSSFPTTTGAYDESYNGGDFDVFVSKLDDDLSSLIASTFLGGSASDGPGSETSGSNDIVIDNLNNVYIAGDTYSSNFPTTSVAYDQTHNGYSDAFIAKFDEDLSTLSASTFLGGSGYEYSYSMILDGSNNIYLAGKVDYGGDFPIVGGYDDTHGGANVNDAFIAKFSNNLSSLEASTFLGGSSEDVSYGISMGISDSYVYVTGTTSSSDFPTTLYAYDKTPSGGSDVFISRLESDLSDLASSTFLGPGLGGGIAIDGLDVYVTGYSSSSDFPTTSGAYQESNGGSFDAFVSRLNYGLSSLAASTFLGGTGDDRGKNILFYNSDVYLVGLTYSNNFPITSGAIDFLHNGDSDIFVSNLDSSLSVLNASTVFGGNDYDSGNDIVLDSSNNLFVVGSAWSPNFPTTSGAYDQIYDGYDSFVARFSGNLSVTSENSSPTDISLSSISIEEGQAAGTEVGTLATADPDSGDSNTYSLACSTSGDDDSFFQIDGDALESAQEFDYENPDDDDADNDYEICIRTNDGNGGTYDENFTVSVSDGDDSVPAPIVLPTPEITKISDIWEDSLKIKIKIDDPDYYNRELIFQVKIENEDENSTDYEKFTETTNEEGEVSVEIEDLEENTDYSFHIRFKIEESGEYSEFSNKEEAETEADIKESQYAPTNLKLEILSDGSVKLTWNDNAKGENGYLIERKEGNGSFEQIDSIDKNSKEFIDDDNLTPGQTYTYRVRAFEGNDYTGYSNEEKVTIGESPGTGDSGQDSSTETGAGGSTETSESAAAEEDVSPPDGALDQDSSGDGAKDAADSSDLEENGENAAGFTLDLIKNRISSIIEPVKDFVSQNTLPLMETAVALGLITGAAASLPNSSVPLLSSNPPALQPKKRGKYSDFIAAINFTSPASLNQVNPFKYFNYLSLLLKPRPEKEWGTVFDSYTKAPLSGAVVLLIEGNAGEVKETIITDKQGRFGFLATEGVYLLKVSRGNYQLDITREFDSLYGQLYVNQPFAISRGQLININVALNLEGFNWREYTQRMIQKYTSKFALLKKYLFNVIYIAGFIYSAVIIYFFPTFLNIAFFILYVALLAYTILNNYQKYGVVVDADTGQPVPFALVSVHNQAGERMAFAVTDVLSRYFLLLENGDYIVKVRGQKLEGGSFNVSTPANVRRGIFKEKMKV
ncbi:MAG: hypothetical protein COX31_03610 [Candidatus Moranbacteria bacterium CG23_combo_of_CG06-09_8_20_14_all_40_16]|nr:MAG: hypothetical protein COX31_03610 [Candidatus Moranbacteria bacterium CG23_combo_of_CG06-09_8_20_14_all_40_16]